MVGLVLAVVQVVTAQQHLLVLVCPERIVVIVRHWKDSFVIFGFSFACVNAKSGSIIYVSDFGLKKKFL